MQKYLKADFLKDVAKEAKNIKKHATREEIDNLSIERLYGRSPTRCIYGMLTGHCRLSRAIDLINMCCPIFFDKYKVPEMDNGMRSISKAKNGSKNPNPTGLSHFSAIESYIIQPWAKNANLIAYLKGETKTLNL